MKTRFFTLLSLAVCLVGWTACKPNNPEIPDDPVIPKYPVTNPVKVAKATSGGTTVDGAIDNEARTIGFRFDNIGADIQKITVHLEYNNNVTPGEGAPTEDVTLDLTNDYVFTLNNNVEDVRYTIHADVTLATLTPILSVSAIAGDRKGSVTLDNDAHTIDILFYPGTDVSKVKVSIAYDERASKGDNAFDEKEIDLTKDYTFKVNNGLEDLTYTIHADFSEESLLDNDLCAVYRVDGDADFIEGSDNMYVECLFDGIWMSAAAAYEEVDWKHFGFTMEAGNHDGHGDWFCFDISAPATLSSIKIWPYWPNINNDPAEFRIFAWTGSGTPQTWAEEADNWELVLTGDHSSLYKNNDACANPPQDKVSKFIEAQYYCFVLDKNFYAIGQDDLTPWWYGRLDWLTMSELQLWVLE